MDMEGIERERTREKEREVDRDVSLSSIYVVERDAVRSSTREGEAE